MIDISIGNKHYQVKEAKTEEELTKGLKGVSKLENDEGMLFYLKTQESQVIFTMSGMDIPIDIIFINQDQIVVDIKENCQPKDRKIINSTRNLEDNDYIKYVLEVNPKSNINVGDELDFDEESIPAMKVLNQDGSTQMELWGGERIFRRVFTKQLIKAVKKAESLKLDQSKFEAQCKVIGRKIFKEIKAQDTRSPEYVKSPQ